MQEREGVMVQDQPSEGNFRDRSRAWFSFGVWRSNQGWFEDGWQWVHGGDDYVGTRDRAQSYANYCNATRGGRFEVRPYPRGST